MMQDDPGVARLIDLALKLEGLYRHASTHAAGVVIGDRPLRELVPLYRDPRSDMPVTQFDMKYVEEAGLVKFDFLGLKTLSVLQRAVELVAAAAAARIDLARAAAGRSRRPTSCCTRGETVGVFQLEVRGHARRRARLQPDRLRGHHRARLALPPGPDGQHPALRRRKNGGRSRTICTRRSKPILKETYGIIVYQEQVMQIAQVLAGYSLGDADLLRRAMGKKIKERDGRAARDASSRARRSAASTTAQGEPHLRPDRQVRRLRLQQEPRRRLRAGRLSDRLAEGELPGRVLRRVDELRHRQHRQARVFRQEIDASASSCCRRTSTSRRPRFSVESPTADENGRGALRARRGQGRRAGGDGGAGRRARGERPVPRPRRFRAAASIPSRSTSACSSSWCGRRASTRSSPTARASSRRSS